MINQQIKILEGEAAVSVSDEEIISICDQVTKLIYENSDRIKKAKASLSETSEEAQYQGQVNACDTAPFTNFAKYGKEDELQYSCEFWELAAQSAIDWDDEMGFAR